MSVGTQYINILKYDLERNLTHMVSSLFSHGFLAEVRAEKCTNDRGPSYIANGFNQSYKNNITTRQSKVNNENRSE